MHILFYSDISDFSGNLQGMIDEGIYKTSIQNMHKLGQKGKLFKSADVSILGHGCGVSQYPQFYDRIKYIYQILPRPYQVRYSGEKGRQILQENWIIALAKSAGNFVIVSISDMGSIKYWHNLGTFLDKAKQKIP